MAHLPEQFRIKEYGQAMKLLEDVRAEVEAGNILSVTVVCETAGGALYGGCTATQNKFTVAAYLMAWALDRIGFVNSQMFQSRLEDNDNGEG